MNLLCTDDVVYDVDVRNLLCTGDGGKGRRSSWLGGNPQGWGVIFMVGG